jgi:hypothetical protein
MGSQKLFVGLGIAGAIFIVLFIINLLDTYDDMILEM